MVAKKVPKRKKEETKWIPGSIRISSPSGENWDDYVCLNLECNNSWTQFVEVRIKHEDFCRALMGRGDTHIEFHTRGLDKIGLFRVQETITFELPEDVDRWDDEGVKKLNELAQTAAGDGWIASTYFGSQNSFFRKDGKEYARTQKYKFLTEKEHKAYLKAKGPIIL